MATTVLSGRYMIYGEIASGGMATVQYGRLLGPVGFARAVAIKRLHAQFARDPEFVSMFIDEARICARLSHANLVPTLDVLESPGELSLVMEYVHGVSLDSLLEVARARNEPVPLRVAVALIAGVLHGLDAAHEVRSEQGELLSIVHRDVSPQNILVGADGIPRVLDFGIAKARGRLRTTPSGEIKGKLSYMAPEQLSSGVIDRRIDLYGAAAVLWEVLAGRTLFEGPNESTIVHKVLYDVPPPPSSERPDVPPELDEIVLRGLSRDPEQRFATAREMASALERALGAASQSEVRDWLEGLASDRLSARALALIQMQNSAEAVAGGTRRLSMAPAGSPPASQEPTPSDAVTGVRPRRTWRPLWLAALLLGVLVALALRFSDGAREKAETVPPQSSPSVSERAPAAPSNQPPPPSEVEQPAAVAPRGLAEPGAAEALPMPSADEPVRHEKSPRRREAPAKRAVGSPARPGRDCTQPFVIDRQGVKRWKPECL